MAQATVDIEKTRLDTRIDQKNDIITIIHTVTSVAGPKVSDKIHWQRKARLGAGGFGEVFLQECVSTPAHNGNDSPEKPRAGALRAVKEVRKRNGETALSEKLRRELQVLIFFAHAKYAYHFVQVSGWYDTPTHLHIAMEYLPLGDLHAYLHTHASSGLPESDAKFITKQILRALEHMHLNAFAHRDLKPSNILVRTRPPQDVWWVKIADFGLAKHITPEGLLSEGCGTRGLLAPELLGFDVKGALASAQARAQAADVWALGETVYRMLMGGKRSPMSKLMGQYVKGKRELLAKPLAAAGVSDKGVDFVRWCMNPAPSSRPSAAAALAHDQWPKTHSPNNYQSIRTEVKATLELTTRHRPSFLLFTPNADALIAVETCTIHLWDLTDSSFTEVSNYWASPWSKFIHASIAPVGRRYLCVTQRGHDHMLTRVFDTEVDGKRVRLFGFINHRPRRVQRRYSGSPDRSRDTISAFSHDATTVGVASQGSVSEIRTGRTPERWELVSAYDLDVFEGRGAQVESMAFARGGARLLVAYQAGVVVMNTRSSGRWTHSRVIDYPCTVKAVAILPTAKLVMAGTAEGGDLWLWVARLECWVSRKRGGAPLMDVQFSSDMENVLFTTYNGTVGLLKAVPLDESSFQSRLREEGRVRVGMTVASNNGTGATALGPVQKKGLSRVVFWKYTK